MASIRPHPTHSGWFVVDYYPNGRKGKREREPFPSYVEALAFQNSLTAPTQQPTHPRIEMVVDDYIDWVRKNQAETTYITKERRFRRWLTPFFGKYRVKDLSRRLFDEYAKLVPNSALFVDLNFMQALITWMEKRDMAEPLKWKIENPAPIRQVKLIPDPPDIMRFIAAMPVPAHRIVVQLMLYSGMRLVEVRGLRWENFNGSIFICRKTKTKQPFAQPIPAMLLPWFLEHRKAQGFVFVIGNHKKPICDIARSIKIAREQTGVYMTPHLFRHASGTFLYEQTSDIYAVQHHLRHSNPSTSQIYTRFSALRRQANIQTLVDYMSPED